MKKNTKNDAHTGSKDKPGNSVNDSDSNKMRKARRRLIQGLVAGGVVVTAKSVPGSWSRPVVEAVMLPAHARTSGELIRLGNNSIFAMNTQDLEPGEAALVAENEQGFSKILDTFVEQAAAADDGLELVCNITDCCYIEYQSGENNGKFYLNVTDNQPPLGSYNLMFNFTDGEIVPFNNECLRVDTGFRIRLVNDDLATLELYDEPDPVVGPFNLVSSFISCPEIEEDS